MSNSPTEAAREVLTVVPLIMCTIRAEMRDRRTHGLSVPKFRTLGFVHWHPGPSLSEVAEHIGLTLPAMSRLVDGLVEGRLVLRRTHPADRRFMTLGLTARGRRLWESALETTLAALSDRFSALDGDQTAAVVRGMRIARPLFGEEDAPRRNEHPVERSSLRPRPAGRRRGPARRALKRSRGGVIS
jgi:DNA-binding MarR family transcriptional regulator